jgi:hypothetical protein
MACTELTISRDFMSRDSKQSPGKFLMLQSSNPAISSSVQT